MCVCPDRQVQKDPSLALKIFLALRFVEHRSQLALPSSLLSALSGRISTVPWETVIQFRPSSNVFRVSSSAHHAAPAHARTPLLWVSPSCGHWLQRLLTGSEGVLTQFPARGHIPPPTITSYLGVQFLPQ